VPDGVPAPLPPVAAPLPAARVRAALHVSNGDCTDVPGTGLAEHVVYWKDVLHEGPVPDVDPETLRRLRAEHLSGGGFDVDPERVARDLHGRDDALVAHRGGDYVLWFEADLYDQLQIIEIVARLADLAVPPHRIHLICIGEHPDIARFGGLGQLDPAQLRELPSTRACMPLTEAAMALATQAWAAFRAPEPSGLAAIAAATSLELRFLPAAFRRLCREYPSTRDGLSLTERRALAALAHGARDAEAVFAYVGALEDRPYLGDTWCFAMLDRLARAPEPLLHAPVDVERVERTTPLALTDVGAQVLAGTVDHVARNGIDRWIGGVHLVGREPRWRWDEGLEALTTV
jgi:hypothetical protein